jgi:hypothetical protein
VKEIERVTAPLRPLRYAPLLLLLCSAPAAAQRELHWSRIEVSAHLGAAGDLHVTETQTMVFTGAWNGGERQFRLRPRQKLFFEGIYRGGTGGWQKLTEDSRLDDVDEYAWSNARTLRWRSRLPSDPVFDGTGLRYELRYVLSAVLLKEGDAYRLNHDFAFPDRDGDIRNFVLRFSHDPAWQPVADLRPVYTAGPLPPGQSFVLNIPFRYTGAQVPATLDLSRPPEIGAAVAAVAVFTTLVVGWFFVRERSHGRFAPLPVDGVDEEWIRGHILKHPAEVVGAAWDGTIGSQEVVALIARMVSEGKLETIVDGEGKEASMTMRLKEDRSRLEGHEGTLVSWLFFDQSNETSTDRVKANYREQGFNPAQEIRPELEARVRDLVSDEEKPRGFRIESVLLFVTGAAALAFAWLLQGSLSATVLAVVCGALVLAGIGCITGAVFRANIQWGRRAALFCLLPAFAIAAGVALFLWFYAGTGFVELSSEALVGVAVIALALINISVNALRSREGRAAMALRKTFAAGREFFAAQLRQERPALRDEWYPWMLAFGLAREVDDWSAQRARRQPVREDRPAKDWHSTTSAPPVQEQWTGFAGGRSGGAGASASWVAAAHGMAAGVAAPKPSGSSSSSDSGGSSSTSSSSSASSGGGGGGGW